MNSYSPELQRVAQSGPAGLGWVANLRQPRPDDDRLESSFLLPDHVKLMNEEIQRLASREYQREGFTGLIVEMPPRHGKSEMISRYTPAWYLGAFPDHRVALASYGDDFAATWGRKARDLIEEFGPGLYGIKVDPRSSAAANWDIRPSGRGRPRVSQGGMATMGVGGQLTGRGADLLIIDDPVKNMVEAQSQAQRDKVWEWWVSTVRTRLEPGGVVIIVMTRWHHDDLIGRLLLQMAEDPGADQWRRVSLPALAEAGDPLGREIGAALWSARYDEEAFERTRKSVGSYVWSALYQQHPTPPEGSLFQYDWFGAVPEMDAGVQRLCRFWDLASTESDGADYTAGVKMARGADGKTYILDVIRGQFNPQQVELMLARTAALDGKTCKVRIEEEKGSSGKLLIDHLRRNVLRGYDVKGVKNTGDKVLRAVPLSAACERGDVKLVVGDWNEDFLSEIVLFDRGPNDDQVDAASGAYSVLNRGSGMVAY